MTTHELKIRAQYFDDVYLGRKKFEIRQNDREPPFDQGDILYLREWEAPGRFAPTGYTGRSLRVMVLEVWDLAPIGIPGFVAMSIHRLSRP